MNNHTCDKQKCENEYCLYRHHSLSFKIIKYNFNNPMPQPPNKEEELEQMYLKVEPLVEKMKAKYPSELNMDGLDPALTNDIAEIVLQVVASQKRELTDRIHRIYDEAYAEGKGDLTAELMEKVGEVHNLPSTSNCDSFNCQPFWDGNYYTCCHCGKEFIEKDSILSLIKDM